jgi:DnaJ domain
MIRIILVVILIGIVWYTLQHFKAVPPKKLAQFSRNFFLMAIAFAVVFLAVTGRLNWLFALIGVAVAFVLRMLPVFLRYVPYLHRMWHQYSTTKQQSSAHGNTTGTSKNDMSVQEAYEVLGLKPGASEQEIVAAHRKLMQKIHPDHGGSDYLAAKINKAKQVLLKK